MSVFNRIAGTEEPKIPVWPLMVDFTMLIDQEITFADLITMHSLSELEQAEVVEYLTAIGGLVTTETGVRIGISWPSESAQRDARVSVHTVLWYACLRIEQGKITENQFRAALGLTPK